MIALRRVPVWISAKGWNSDVLFFRGELSRITAKAAAEEGMDANGFCF
jgi:hypothetical protein